MPCREILALLVPALPCPVSALNAPARTFYRLLPWPKVISLQTPLTYDIVLNLSLLPTLRESRQHAVIIPEWIKVEGWMGRLIVKPDRGARGGPKVE